MLLNFRVENFKSFKNYIDFSMEATKLTNLAQNTFTINNISLLKTAPIYGANASGKSNLTEAMLKMKNIVKKSFDIEKRAKILEEWLFCRKLKKRAKEIILFKRNNKKIELGVSFKEGKDIEDKIRDNSLFLVVVANFNGKIYKICC